VTDITLIDLERILAFTPGERPSDYPGQFRAAAGWPGLCNPNLASEPGSELKNWNRP
jgi:hypothetical protein